MGRFQLVDRCQVLDLGCDGVFAANPCSRPAAEEVQVEITCSVTGHLHLLQHQPNKTKKSFGTLGKFLELTQCGHWSKLPTEIPHFTSIVYIGRGI